MYTTSRSAEIDGFAKVSNAHAAMLSEQDEWELLQELADCKQKLAAALASIQGQELPIANDDPKAMAQFIAQAYPSDCRNEARLGAVHHRYAEIRDRLVMSNLRLVAHVAKRFRDRGVPYADLLQEGFCGLLTAIDRFETTHKTKLATYATWWIRQSMQSTVASCAYPVRLTPRHLRQLAQSQEADSSNGSETIQRIQSATRPTISLDARPDDDSNFSMMEALSDDRAERVEDVDSDDGLKLLMGALRPRERQVLSLRFGLEGDERLSLSEVGKILEVSKERIRQIQDSALKKLRAVIEDENLVERLSLGA